MQGIMRLKRHKLRFLSEKYWVWNLEKGFNINFLRLEYVIKARTPISRMGGQGSSKWATVELRLSIIKGIIANRCQNVGSFSSFCCGWIIVDFLVWHYSYWPMRVNYLLFESEHTELKIFDIFVMNVQKWRKFST